jgi:hypothetical protein
VFLTAFCATRLALARFLAPSSCHRLATPLHDKRRFIALGARVLASRFVPRSSSTVRSVHPFVSLVLDRACAHSVAAGSAVLVLVTWWIVPRLRIHERVARPTE